MDIEKMLKEIHKICDKCLSGQDKVVGKRCQGCIDYNEYEPINEAKKRNMVRKLESNK